MESNNIYELAIIGGGPGGASAGIYAARKKIKTILITDGFGGPSTVSPDIQNWVGIKTISGQELSDSMEKHLREYAVDIVNIKDSERAENIFGNNKDGFEIKTDKGNIYKTKTILVTTGSHRRRLQAKNADKLEHRGITYCATCDGPLFAGRDVVVIGGGNAGFETASQLLAYAKSVTLLTTGETFSADPVTIEKVLTNSKMKALNNIEVLEVKGDKMVTTIIYKDKKTGEQVELPTGGIFVEVGQIPATEFVKGVVEMDTWDHIVIDPRTQKTNVPGIWAA